VSSLDVDITFNNLNACFVNSADLLKTWTDTNGGAALSQATMTAVTFTGTPRLLYRMYVPTVSVPQVLSIPYVEPVVFREPFSTFADIGDSKTISTRSYQLNQVPHRIMIFARPRGHYVNSTSPEAFLTVESLNFRTSSDAGGLSNATTAQLFQISNRNGVSMTYQKFSRDIGSVIVLDLEKGDIGGYVAGSRENFMFEIVAKFKNTQYDVPAASGSPTFY
jgi:hypothetical protein